MGMDLERRSRDELRAEAERRGIPNASRMDRTALIHALRRVSRVPVAIMAARSWVDGLVERVRIALPRGRRPTPPRSRDLPASSAPPPAAPPEPILTQTMAGVLAAQGHYERALAIYDHLLGERPEDRALIAAADRVRGQLSGEGRGERNPDQVVAVRVRGAILVSWQVGPRTLARTRTVLGVDGELIARLVVVAPDRDQGARTLLRELRPAKTEGEWLVDDVPSNGTATAVVGLAAGDRFVSAVHSGTLVLEHRTV